MGDGICLSWSMAWLLITSPFEICVFHIPWCHTFSCSCFHLHHLFVSQVSGVQMHESGSEPTSHAIPAVRTQNGKNAENDTRLRSGHTPPPESPRVSLFPLASLYYTNTNCADAHCGNVTSVLRALLATWEHFSSTNVLHTRKLTAWH